ncbi:hypothetical protein AB1E18_005843 [Capra hircus]
MRRAEPGRTWAGQNGEGSRRDLPGCGPGETSGEGDAGARPGIWDPSSADEVSGADVVGGGRRSPRTRVCCEAGGGAGRDGKWDGELGPGEEARGGVGAESWRRPDRDRFLPERRPALDRGAGGGRPRAGADALPPPPPPPPPLHLLVLLQLLSLPPPPPPSGEVSLPTLARNPDPERSGELGGQLQRAAG